jgi:hypothetical protein
MIDVTWLSQPGQNYILYYSPDLIDWTTDIADSIEAKDDSEVTTFGPFLNPNTKLLKGFFRVRKKLTHPLLPPSAAVQRWLHGPFA